MNEKFDIIVIGGGPGGTPAAMQLAASGKKVLLVEESGKLGGACLFIGCIPSKIIKHVADDFKNLERTIPASSDSAEALADTWKKIQGNMDRILNGRSSAALKHLNQLPITFVAGKAKFYSKKEVVVNNNHYYFDKAIIATGAHSFIPPFKGNGLSEVLTSETLFLQPRLPESLIIVGGGPIGIELAQMLTKLHVKCTIVEMMPTLLSGVVEPEFSEGIEQKLKETGVDIYTHSNVREINKINNKFQTIFMDAERESQEIFTDNVLIVTGKVPSTDGLNLEATGIRFDQKGIYVNEFLETNVTGIYATGDVMSGSPKFAHTATYEAHIAAANILRGNTSKVSFAKNAWVLFSDPEIAAAGYTEAGALKAGYNVITGTYNYKVDAATQINGDTFGFLKFVVNKDNQEILGVHIFINGAASLSGEASLIVSQKLTLMDVANTIHPHPTLTEAFGMLAMKMLTENTVREPLLSLKQIQE